MAQSNLSANYIPLEDEWGDKSDFHNQIRIHKDYQYTLPTDVQNINLRMLAEVISSVRSFIDSLPDSKYKSKARNKLTECWLLAEKTILKPYKKSFGG